MRVCIVSVVCVFLSCVFGWACCVCACCACVRVCVCDCCCVVVASRVCFCCVVARCLLCFSVLMAFARWWALQHFPPRRRHLRLLLTEALLRSRCCRLVAPKVLSDYRHHHNHHHQCTCDIHVLIYADTECSVVKR